MPPCCGHALPRQIGAFAGLSRPPGARGPVGPCWQTWTSDRCRTGFIGCESDATEDTPLSWTPAREVLDHEAHDFTPWLAENLHLLSDTLGLDALELVSTEWKVDTFSLDILAQGSDADGDVMVVIENQHGQTDHSHLGQLLTYAAGAAAGGGRVLAVWLVEEVRPAHLAAVEFLNRISASEEASFGVVLLRVRFTPSPEGFYVYFEIEAQPNSFISSTPHASVKSFAAIAEQGDFIDEVVTLLDPALKAAGSSGRAGKVNRKHGAVIYRLPKSLNVCRYVNLRVVCSASYTNVAIFVEGAETADGNWASAELLKATYQSKVAAYGLTVDTCHGSSATTKRDRVIAKLGVGYSTGTPSDVANRDAQILGGWARLLQEHPLTAIAAQLESADE